MSGSPTTPSVVKGLLREALREERAIDGNDLWEFQTLAYDRREEDSEALRDVIDLLFDMMKDISRHVDELESMAEDFGMEVNRNQVYEEAFESRRSESLEGLVKGLENRW